MLKKVVYCGTVDTEVCFSRTKSVASVLQLAA
jgi:hypothetical protein